MRNRKPMKKNDVRHCDPAIPPRGIFEVQTTLKRKKAGSEQELRVPWGVKLNYVLHTPPFICFNTQIKHFKKTP